MDWLQFLVSVLGLFAWPATVVVVVVLMRTQLRRVLLTLTRLRYKDLELDFGRELKEVEKKAREIDVKPSGPPPRPLAAPRDSAQILAEAERLAEEFPEPAVALARSAVEDELLSAVMRLAISPHYPPHNSALRNVQLLLDQKSIDHETFDVLTRMRNLRNIAVHGRGGVSGVSSDEAREFIALVRGIVEKVRRLRRD